MDDVLLHRPAVMHLADILQEYSRSVGVSDRNIVEVVDGGGHRIGAHRVLSVPDLGETRRQGQVLGIDRVHHVCRRQTSGLELDRVDVDHDLPVLAPVRSRKCHTGHRGKLLAQIVQPVIVQLLLVEAVGAKAELQHRDAGGIVLHHDRRLDPGWHEGADGVCGCDDLRNRQIEIDIGLEVNLLHRDAVERLRLHVLDPSDARTHRVLAVGGDALLHFRCAQAGVLPDHRDDRNVDLRKDVGGRDRNGRDAEK